MKIDDAVDATLLRSSPKRPLHLARAVALLLAATIALAGCGFVNTPTPAKTAGSKTLDITVSTDENTALADLVPAFEKKTGITVNVKFAATADLNEQIRVQLTSGTAPDVFRVSPGSSSPIAAKILGNSGNLATMTGSWTSAVPSAVGSLSSVNGKLKAFPLSQNIIVMAYNKDVFTKLGLTPPKTWNQFLTVCAKLKAAGITPVSAGFTGGIYLQFLIYQLAASIVYGADPGIDAKMQSGKVTFSSSSEWKEVFTKFVQLQKLGYFTDGANGITGDQAAQAVAAGNAGMISVVSTLLPKGNVGVFALPGTDSASDTRIPVAPDFLGINAKAKNAENAHKFIDFLAQPANVAAYAKAANVLPGLTTKTAPDSEALKPVLSYVTSGKTASYANYLWPNGDTQQRLLQSGQQVLTGEITIDALLDQLSTEYAKGTP